MRVEVEDGDSLGGLLLLLPGLAMEAIGSHDRSGTTIGTEIRFFRRPDLWMLPNEGLDLIGLERRA